MVGKEVVYVVENKVQSGREYGSAWITVGGQLQNVTDMLISEGLVEVRQVGGRQTE